MTYTDPPDLFWTAAEQDDFDGDPCRGCGCLWVRSVEVNYDYPEASQHFYLACPSCWESR